MTLCHDLNHLINQRALHDRGKAGYGGPVSAWAHRDLQLRICVSIDRIPQDPAPTRCLPFDPIGVRHPGIPASASPHVDLQQARNLISPFAFRSKASLVSRGSRGGPGTGTLRHAGMPNSNCESLVRVRNDRVKRTLSLLKRQRMARAALSTALPPPRRSLLAHSFFFSPTHPSL